MKTEYKAILRQNHIEWIGEAPNVVAPDQAVNVTVTIEDSPMNDEARRERAFWALEQLAARGGIPSIGDPAVWQREIRKDRPLPFRDE